ncbi:hypothetical protein [Actinomadura miaoliensis]|uniref:hypothetical protein n=1 Tax=Actinomadura miaoliensis TaxID=430685 RepID=UPI0031E9247F
MHAEFVESVVVGTVARSDSLEAGGEGGALAAGVGRGEDERLVDRGEAPFGTVVQRDGEILSAGEHGQLLVDPRTHAVDARERGDVHAQRGQPGTVGRQRARDVGAAAPELFDHVRHQVRVDAAESWWKGSAH